MIKYNYRNGVDMDNYNSLKKDTYLYLLKDNDEVKRLITSILLISLCHDECIVNNQDLLVSLNFIKKCNSLVNFKDNFDTFSRLDDISKFSLIRNKLAHGDFVIDSEKNIIIKHVIDGCEVNTSFPINSIISFANEIVNYYDYIDSDKEREKIYIRDGVKVTIKDKPLKRSNRSETYNNHYKTFLSAHLSRFIRAYSNDNPVYNHKLNDMSLKFNFEYTDEENKIIDNPNANSLISLFKVSLKDNNYDQKVVSLLIKFYIYYFYPLENFLKGEDKNIHSLKNDDMFNFSKLDLDNAKDSSIKSTVGKVANYHIQLNESYQKINMLMEKRNNLEVALNRNPSLQIKQKYEELNKEIEELVDLFCNSSVQSLYKYSENRSIVEHLRCSIMHGNYSYNELDDTFLFKDLWKGQELYCLKLSYGDFKSLINFRNINAVIEQFDNTSKNKKKIK